jgi:ribosomal protein S18 acetylase RimI-like enzyme
MQDLAHRPAATAAPVPAKPVEAPPTRFNVTLDVHIRPCRETDLPALEWFGLFAGHRSLIEREFVRQEKGDALMLIADVSGEASGQLWLELRRHGPKVGVIWALRVMPCLQGQGIGTRMLAIAEAYLRERGYRCAQLAVETDNPRARRLYEHLGYRLVRTEVARHPPGFEQQPTDLHWILAKDLQA